MKIRNELKVGALTVVGVVALILGFYYLKGEDLFTKTKKMYVLLEDAAGIVSANPVSMYGKQIGKVSDVTFKQVGNYNVIFGLSINKDVQIAKHSIVKIIELDLLGNKELRIINPDTIQGYCNDKDTLYGEVKGNLFASVENKISPILELTEPLLMHIDSLVVNINGLMQRNQAAIDASIASLQSTLDNFDKISTDARDLITSQSDTLKSILSNLNELTATFADNSPQIDSMIDNFATLSGKLSELEFAELMDNASESLEQIKSILTTISSGEGSIGKLLYEDNLANQIDSTLGSLNALLEDLMANPKRYVSFSLIERKDKEPKQ